MTVVHPCYKCSYRHSYTLLFRVLALHTLPSVTVAVLLAAVVLSPLLLVVLLVVSSSSTVSTARQACSNDNSPHMQDMRKQLVY